MTRVSASTGRRVDTTDRVWISVAGDLDQARAVANALMHDGSQAGTRLGTRILAAIPRLEAGEEVCPLLSSHSSGSTISCDWRD